MQIERLDREQVDALLLWVHGLLVKLQHERTALGDLVHLKQSPAAAALLSLLGLVVDKLEKD